MMKYKIQLLIFTILLSGCQPLLHQGSYVYVFNNILGEKFQFDLNNNKFKFTSTVEGNIKYYAIGNFKTEGNEIYLFGSDSGDINRLNLNFTIRENLKENIIFYSRTGLINDDFIVSELIINNSNKIKLKKTDTLNVDYPISTVKIISYLDNHVLFTIPPTVDTLVSDVVQLGSKNYTSLSISTNYDIQSFYRVPLKDTLIIKSGKTLISGSKKYTFIKKA